MRCPACRSRIGRHDTFCGVCGTPFGNAAAPATAVHPPASPRSEGALQLPLPQQPPVAPSPPVGGAPVAATWSNAGSESGASSSGRLSSIDSAGTAKVAVPPRACTNCGASIAPEDIFCGYCGNVNTAILDARLNRLAPPAPPVAPASPPPSPVSEPRSTYEAEYSTDSFEPRGPISAAPAPERVAYHPSHGADAAFVVERAAASSSAPVIGDSEETVIIPRKLPAVTFKVEFSTGQSEIIAGPTIIGRNPRASEGEVGATRIVLNDPTRSVSKTHGEFSIVEGVLYYRDRSSANGSDLVINGEVRALEPEHWTELSSGSEVLLGDQKFIIL